MKPSEVGGKRFSIIGGARSGVAVASLLQAHGGQVFVSDTASVERMQQAKQELDAKGIPSEFGGHSARAREADVVVLSPGVPSDAGIVREVLAAGRSVVSEVEVASWFCRAPILAITGTNGKTTTTSLAGRIFEDAKRPCRVAGNIGTAFSGIVDELDENATAILEISSFQLDHVDEFRPRVAVMLNITPDHLDRYGHSFERYVAAKCRIMKNQQTDDVVVYNHDDEVTRTNILRNKPPRVRALPFSTREQLNEGACILDGTMKVTIGGDDTVIIPVGELSIRGEHNVQNALAAALASVSMDIPVASLRATLRNFKGVEHRLEFVREVDGVVYVNDSKATNVDSVWYALQSFQRPLVVLIGGRDKGNDYGKLVPLVKQHVRAVVAIGESADKVKTVFSPVVPVSVAADMEEAVQQAGHRAQRGDVVLLSPACASFDWFENYEHRGNVFKAIVSQL